MKGIVLLLLVLINPLPGGGDNYLEKVSLYQKESYYKQKVYAEKDRAAFYALADVNKVIDPQDYDMHLLNAALFYATNKQRAAKGAGELRFSPALRDAAVLHTDQMVEKNFFDHFNAKNRKYYSPEKRFKLFGLEPPASAENIDYTYLEEEGSTTYLQLAEAIVKDLYDSPAHRKNMLSKAYNSLGCAVVFEHSERDGNWYCKATQDFAAIGD